MFDKGYRLEDRDWNVVMPEWWLRLVTGSAPKQNGNDQMKY